MLWCDIQHTSALGIQAGLLASFCLYARYMDFFFLLPLFPLILTAVSNFDYNKVLPIS